MTPQLSPLLLPRCFACIGLLLFAAVTGHAQTFPIHPENEPAAPDVLELVVTDSGLRSGKWSLEAVVKPTLNSTFELEIVTRAGNRKRPAKIMQRGDPAIREKVQIDISDGKPQTITARLRLLGTDGKPWLVIERVAHANQPALASSNENRVPVVQTPPDGTRLVEYLPVREAVARGLGTEGKPAPSIPQIHPDAQGEQ